MATATPSITSPLLESFRQREATRDVRLLAASGGLAPRAAEQIELLVMLRVDEDPEVAATAQRTLDGLNPASVAAVLAGSETSDDARGYFAARGIVAAASGVPEMVPDAPLVDAGADERGATGGRAGGVDPAAPGRHDRRAAHLAGHEGDARGAGHPDP